MPRKAVSRADPDVGHAWSLIAPCVGHKPGHGRRGWPESPDRDSGDAEPASRRRAGSGRLSKFGAADEAKTLTLPAAGRGIGTRSTDAKTTIRQLVGRIREMVSAVVPTGKKVAVISEGQSRAAQAHWYAGVAFPSGRRWGVHPAIIRPTAMTSFGGWRRYADLESGPLLVPKTSLWWLGTWGMNDFLKKYSRA